jgi:hypothetical protein
LGWKKVHRSAEPVTIGRLAFCEESQSARSSWATEQLAVENMMTGDRLTERENLQAREHFLQSKLRVSHLS